ncbi:MAG: zinc-ribbon domain-containing protein [Candidatus Hodarchaeota archaeon]
MQPPRYCSNCGKKLPALARFCPYCGASTSSRTSQLSKKITLDKYQKADQKPLESEEEVFSFEDLEKIEQKINESNKQISELERIRKKIVNLEQEISFFTNQQTKLNQLSQGKEQNLKQLQSFSISGLRAKLTGQLELALINESLELAKVELNLKNVKEEVKRLYNKREILARTRSKIRQNQENLDHLNRQKKKIINFLSVRKLETTEIQTLKKHEQDIQNVCISLHGLRLLKILSERFKKVIDLLYSIKKLSLPETIGIWRVRMLFNQNPLSEILDIVHGIDSLLRQANNFFRTIKFQKVALIVPNRFFVTFVDKLVIDILDQRMNHSIAFCKENHGLLKESISKIEVINVNLKEELNYTSAQLEPLRQKRKELLESFISSKNVVSPSLISLDLIPQTSKEAVEEHLTPKLSIKSNIEPKVPTEKENLVQLPEITTRSKLSKDLSLEASKELLRLSEPNNNIIKPISEEITSSVSSESLPEPVSIPPQVEELRQTLNKVKYLFNELKHLSPDTFETTFYTGSIKRVIWKVNEALELYFETSLNLPSIANFTLNRDQEVANFSYSAPYQGIKCTGEPQVIEKLQREMQIAEKIVGIKGKTFRLTILQTNPVHGRIECDALVSNVEILVSLIGAFGFFLSYSIR